MGNGQSHKTGFSLHFVTFLSTASDIMWKKVTFCFSFKISPNFRVIRGFQMAKSCVDSKNRIFYPIVLKFGMVMSIGKINICINKNPGSDVIRPEF